MFRRCCGRLGIGSHLCGEYMYALNARATLSRHYVIDKAAAGLTVCRPAQNPLHLYHRQILHKLGTLSSAILSLLIRITASLPIVPLRLFMMHVGKSTVLFHKL